MYMKQNKNETKYYLSSVLKLATIMIAADYLITSFQLAILIDDNNSLK